MIPIECHELLVKLGTVERSEVYLFQKTSFSEDSEYLSPSRLLTDVGS